MVVDAGPTMVDSIIKSLLPHDKEKGSHIMNLVIDADDLLKIREKVCELYVDKKVMVAPCLSKLYISRAQQVIDCEGKTTPDWFYFGTGVIALIYDTNRQGLKIVLFEERSCRLLWCMNWASYVTIQSQTSNFHILNTKPDFSQHVGFLYENRDVADLILNAITLISTTDTKQHDEVSSCTQCEDHRDKTRLLRSISMNGKKGNNKLTRQVENGEVSDYLRFFKRRSSLRDSLLRKTISRKYDSCLAEQKCEQKVRSSTVIGTISKDEHQKNNSTCTDNTASEEQTVDESTSQKKTVRRKLTSLSRANSFRKAVNNLEDDDKASNSVSLKSDPDSNISKRETKPNNFEHKLSRNSTEVRENIVKNLFRKRRISRSQSLKTINRKRDSQISQTSQCSQVSQSSQNDEKEQTEVLLDSKYYQRTKKLVKTRSSTDSLLLRGEVMQNIIETGHVARYARQRKQWSKRLETTEMPSTDLCVTEL